ncbi:MAG: pyruvate ferredoxin oxidoreductase [Actinomycetota bacterium]
MGLRLVDTANHVAAQAARLSRVEVVSAYPITPQTQVIEEISRFISEEGFDCEYIPVESEHSAMAAMIGAVATGVRAFSATASHGLEYMHELLHWAAGIRLPMVMVNVNRAIGPGWNIWCDHQDTMSARDTGWIQLYCASHQEVLDTVIQAYRITEDLKVILPVMVCYDAFTMSHTYMQVDVHDQEKIDRFLPPFRTLWKLDVDCPFTHGSVIYPDDYEEVRYSIEQAQKNARGVIKKAAQEYREIVGEYHGDLMDTYAMEDAEHAIVAIGTVASEGKVAVDQLRASGYPCGIVRIRSYRPFPVDELRELITDMKTVMVLDRGVSFGIGGILYSEVKSLLYGRSGARTFNLISGLGGKDVTYNIIAEYAEAAIKGRLKQETTWPNVKLTDHHKVSKRGLEEFWKKEGVL